MYYLLVVIKLIVNNIVITQYLIEKLLFMWQRNKINYQNYESS